MPLLECRQVSKAFGQTVVLRETSFTVEDGEHLAITGPSGAGKSTLLGLLAGLLEPTGGVILQDGRAVSAPGSVVRPDTRGLGVLLQGLGLWPHLSVLQNVELAIPAASGRLFPLSGWLARRRFRRELAEKALSDVGLSHLARRRPQDLSGGERQRAAWARAVAGGPRILLLDEPLTSLDPALEEDLVRLVLEYGSQPGRTVLIVTHRHEVAARVGRKQLALVPTSRGLAGSPP